jgi:hypothetical protein
MATLAPDRRGTESIDNLLQAADGRSPVRQGFLNTKDTKMNTKDTKVNTKDTK